MKQTSYFFTLGMLFLNSLFCFAQVDQEYLKYLGKREALKQMDSLAYFDDGMPLSQKERLVNEKLLDLQKKMLQTYKEGHFFPPARNFYGSKKHIEQTALFRIIQKMPKGGVLHIHTPAMGEADWLINRAIQLPEMHVYWEDDGTQFIKGTFRAFNADAVPAGFVSVGQTHANDPAFFTELRDLLTFDKGIDQDSVDIWGEFQAVFSRIGGLVSYRPVFKDYVVHSLQLMAADNIQHAELRMTFRNRLYDLNPTDYATAPIEGFVTLLEQIQGEIRQTDPEFTLKIIHSNLRFRDQATIWKDIEEVYEFRKQYPQWLMGYDLVAEEDNGHPTLFHAKTFLRLDSLEKADGITFPLYLHDGESSWASVDNLYDAILLGTKRIGHGFNLFRFPTLINLVREHEICMEINPLSNQILGYIRDLRIHPASTYLRRGINCVISSDDPLIFDYKGLSYDFWSVFMAWELDLAALKKLSFNSLNYSTLEGKEKERALNVWSQRWDQFVDEALQMLDQ